MNVDKGMYYGLDDIGTRIWELVESPVLSPPSASSLWRPTMSTSTPAGAMSSGSWVCCWMPRSWTSLARKLRTLLTYALG